MPSPLPSFGIIPAFITTPILGIHITGNRPETRLI
jgi:hypothetical protein